MGDIYGQSNTYISRNAINDNINIIYYKRCLHQSAAYFRSFMVLRLSHR